MDRYMNVPEDGFAHWRAFLRKVLALCMAIALLMPILPEAWGSQARAAENGMLRIWLTRLGSGLKSISLRLEGSYSINGDAKQKLAKGTKAQVSLESGKLHLTINGVKKGMGSSFSLRRHKTSGNNGIFFTQPNLSNIFNGDITFDINGGGIRPVLTIHIEEYLYGVVAYEMSDSFPLEALKAQSVAARTYAIKRRYPSRAYDLVDNANDQVFKGYNATYQNVIRAVNETKGVCAMFKGDYAQGYFAASNGGQTDTTVNAWGGGGQYTYIVMKDDPYDLENPSSLVKRHKVPKVPSSKQPLNASLETALKKGMVTQLKAKGYKTASASDMEIVQITDMKAHSPRFKAPSRTFSSIAFTMNVNATKDEKTVLEKGIVVNLETYGLLKNMLSLKLNSTNNEIVSIANSSDAYTIEFRRWGHGVGMSQRGAQWMAKQYGKSYRDILLFYYEGINLVKKDFANVILPENQGPSITAPPATSTPAPGKYQKLVYGTRNNADVKKMQQRLAELGFFSGSPAGNYLDTTAAAVLKFQKAAGLPNDKKTASAEMLERLYAKDAPGAGGKTPAPTAKPTAKPTVKPSEQPGSKKVYARVKLSSKNATMHLRKSASTSSKSLAKLKNNARVEVVGASGSWAKVVAAGKTGYMKYQYLNLEVPTGRVKLKSGGTMNIRQKPSTSSAIMGRVNHGDSLEIIEYTGAWYRVRRSGVTGYVKQQYIVLDKGAKVPKAKK